MKYAAWRRTGQVRMLRLPPWRIALIFVLALALGIAIAVVATGVFLIALPIAAVAALAYRLFGRGRGKRGRARPPVGSVIEGDYEVIDGPRRRSQS
jgi:hypothetical protein